MEPHRLEAVRRPLHQRLVPPGGAERPDRERLDVGARPQPVGGLRVDAFAAAERDERVEQGGSGVERRWLELFRVQDVDQPGELREVDARER